MFGFKLNKASLLWLITWIILAIAIVIGTMLIYAGVNALFYAVGQPVLGIMVTTAVLTVLMPIAYLFWYISKPKCVSGNTIIDFIYFLFGGPFYIAARLTDKDCKGKK